MQHSCHIGAVKRVGVNGPGFLYPTEDAWPTGEHVL